MSVQAGGGSVVPQDFDEEGRELDPEEMAQLERELAEDAQWKRIQKNTFTRWANEHLKLAQDQIEDLELDLSNGLRLIKLIQVLSGKLLPRHNKSPSFRSQKLENVSVALKFLEEQNIRLVNIDSSDIVDSKLKLILGLIWTLILHYSISIPMLESEADLPNGNNATPKQRLMNWIQNKLGDLPVKNFTSDWRDGKAVGALVDSIAPGLCPDWQHWQPTDAVKNASEAMGLADDWLDVRQLIKPEEMISPDIDEQSMMTYLSQYPNAKLKPGAPLRPKSNPAKVRTFGPGLETPGVVANSPTTFTIDSSGAGLGKVEAFLIDPKGRREPVDVLNRENGIYNASYTPRCEGPHKVHIKFNGMDVLKSPYTVTVDKAVQLRPVSTASAPSQPLCDPKKVRVGGRGLQNNGVRVGDTPDIQIFTDGCGEGVPEILIIQPGGEIISPTIMKKADGKYEALYRPAKKGRYNVMIKYGGQEIPKSPFEVNVGPPKESKIRAYGPGLSGGAVGHPALFTVETNDETGELGFTIKGPSQARIDCVDNHNGSANVKYFPTAPGEYAVHILCDEEDIPQSPFIAQILPAVNSRPDKVEVTGPGIWPSGVVAGAPTQFTVNTQNAGAGQLKTTVLDSSFKPVPVSIVEGKNGTYNCSYTPVQPGKFVVQASYDGVAVPKSPFQVNVDGAGSNIKVSGPGVEPGVTCNQPTFFTIDATKATGRDVQLSFFSAQNESVDLKVEEVSDGLFEASYTPKIPGDYKLRVRCGDQEIPQSPITVKVAPAALPDVSKIKVLGLEKGITAGTPTDFWVDAKALADRDEKLVNCQITNSAGRVVENKVKSYPDGTYKVVYTPFEEGRHLISICYDKIPVPGSPFVVNVEKKASKCKVHGPGLERGIVGKPNTITLTQDGAPPGRLEIMMEGPTEPKLTCKDNHNGTVDIAYTPDAPGHYDLVIKYGGESIEGSPFVIPVVAEPGSIDPMYVAEAYGPGLDPSKVRSNVPTHFYLRANQPGEAMVHFETTKGPLPQKPVVVDNGDGFYHVSYVPPETDSELVIHVKHQGSHIPNSPYRVKVLPEVEPRKVQMDGPGLGNNVVASLPTHFIIDTSSAGYADLQVQILGPDGKPRKVQVKNMGEGIFKASYTPDDVGRYTVNVKYGNEHVSYSPAAVQVVSTGSADKCEITEGIARKLTTGEEYCITVNAKNAGYGAVTCKIRSTSDSDVDIDIDDNGDGTFTIYYSVQDAGEYTIQIKFGGQPVPNGVYNFSVDSDTSSDVKSSSRRSTRSEKFHEVQLNNIPIPNTGGQATADVKMPTGNVDKPVITDNQDGTVSIAYDPKEEGLHELLIKYNGEHVQGSPFKFHVDSISSGYVTAYGPGLSHGVCGEHANFTISTKGAGSGGLKMAVEGPSKAEISCHDNKDGTVAVTYLPTAPGEYKISVMFSDKHIKGSPFSAKITGEGRKRSQISVASCSEVSLPGKVTESEIRTFNASIVSPSGLEEPCYLKLLPNGNLCVSFTPRMPGEHQVSVKKMGKHITNSPYKINVKEREVGDSRKVEVTGALKEGKTHEENFFTVDTRNAGFGGLSLSIEGPSKVEISCTDLEDGTLKIGYKPTEPGYYIVNLKFADHHVTGSPFTVKVSGEGSNRVREKIQRQREAVPVTEVGGQCKLTFKMPGITSFDLTATVTSPGGVSEDAEINEVEDGLYAVKFVPKELGVHTVSVRYKEIHIPGSPFQFTVGPLKDSGAHRVHAGGPGLERGEQGESCEFNVWTREAGAGSLAVSIEGPSKAEIDYKDRKDGSCYVSYVVSEPGEYRIGIKFNDQHIPDSPYKVYISPAVGDAHKLEVAQFPETGVKADCPSSFLVRKNGAKGDLDGKIVSPGGIEDDCFIQSIDSDTYSVRFMPRDNGIHNIHCKFNGVHIPGSPFRIKVGKEDADPAAVHAAGNGITEIKTGAKADFIVDTCNAGAGTLGVTIDGPSKVAMDCSEIEEGYKVRYTPLSPGDYYISVKYNGYHIVGSPFKVPCTGDDLAESGAQETSSVVVETVLKNSKNSKQGPVLPLFKSDASKVTSKGMGLKKAYLQKQNMFTVHCGDAGNNILFVGIYGPKGPCDEVFIKHMGRNNYQVNYVVRERGEYIVLVRWGDEHIPGSPFKVDV